MPVPITQLSATLANRYTIERELGAGGMATVYLAHDLKHDRKVALKVLKPELAAVVGSERFLAEIKTTANLQHPHILPLFDSGEADGFLFFVMPYVEGESLRDRLDREKQLPVDEAVRIAIEVADALAHAHAKGVIHRDIKPANILLRDGRVQVADFGIALSGRPEPTNRLTSTGMSVGTAGYMSPEQAFGDPSLDQRTDIYSLGALLFEMLAGEPPFSGPSAQNILAKQLTAPVPSVRAVRPAVPPAVDRAVARALAISPADRFELVDELVRALRSTSSTVESPPEEPMSILVLPFANRSPDPDQEFLSDGLTEEIINDLSKIRALRVISRNSAMLLKGTTKNTSTIAREVGVSHVLSGSVRRSGDALRIMAELVDGATDNPVWSDKFSGTVADVFDMQEQVAHSIVEALSLQLRPIERRQLSERPFGNVRAYECYLRARQEMWRFTPDALRRSVKLLEEGLGIVGDNALLYAALGHAYFQHVNAMIRTDDEPLRKAEACVEKCFALVPRMPEAYLVRGMIAWFRGEWRAAFQDVREALRLQSQDPDALIWASVLYTYSGQLTRAKEAVDQLLSIDPLTSVGSVGLGLILWMEGRFEEALVPMSKAYEMDPTIMVTAFYAQTLRHAGRAEEGKKLLQDAPAIGFQEWMVAITLAGWEQRRRDVLALGNDQYAGSAKTLGIWSLWVAEAYALAGAEEEALEWLENAIDRGLIYPPFLATHNRSLAHQRGKPRFEALMARAQREWEEISLEAGIFPETTMDVRWA